MAAHRLFNKGIPEAPNHNRKAQKRGRQTGSVLAAGALVVTAGLVYNAFAKPAEPTRIFNNEADNNKTGPQYFKTPYIQPPQSQPAPLHI